MFFIVSKAIAFLLVPSNVILLCGFSGLVLWRTRWRRLGARLASFFLFVFVFLAVVPVGGFLLSILESRFPPWDARNGAPDGIVVLGGAILPLHSTVYGAPMVSSDAGRLIAMGRLAHAYPNARIVYSGGDASLFNDGTEADFVPALLDSIGVPRSRVTLETKARNTTENALLAMELMRPKPGERWLLVTSAYHMPRAIGAFRQAGFAVEAYPSNWYTLPQWRWQISRLLGGVETFDFAMREWIGLVAYRATGKSDALLPGP